MTPFSQPHTMKRILALGLLLMLAGFALAAQAQDLPAAGDLDEGWTRMEVPGAVCALGDPYAFFVRPGDPEKLLVYFQGGGACWDRATCGAFGPYDKTVGTLDEEVYTGGIFDFADERNPVADYSMVFVSYCSGDVHTGSASATLGGDDPLDVEFQGYTNATAALDWAFANYPAVDQVFVTGTSAGAYGALFNAPRIFDAYPEAEQRVLGDAGIGVTPVGWSGFELWGLQTHLPEALAAELEQTPLTTALVDYTMDTYPEARIAQYTSAGDRTQSTFFTMMGGEPNTWAEGMRAQLEPLAEREQFNAWIAPGASHGILPAPLFYTAEANGVPFHEWLRAWLAGEPVESAWCEGC